MSGHLPSIVSQLPRNPDSKITACQGELRLQTASSHTGCDVQDLPAQLAVTVSGVRAISAKTAHKSKSEHPDRATVYKQDSAGFGGF
ncbi:hypothetical protein RRG08_009729 [Elysia crispata]|uniref:Uncharacterized protein n=1 Tax=Elysia crispata TaxID=231223 RepID=A0AAE0Y9K1_9GAST|nr:hypothetical protein RRG08_009729 [Elysia crispata]